MIDRWQWRRRIGIAVAAWLGAVLVLAVTSMRPAVVGLAAVTAAGAAVLWLVLDLSDVSAPVDWRAHSDASAATRGADARVRVLRRQITDGRMLDGPSALHRSLVEIVDDALRAHHRIDRSSDPSRAADVLGRPLYEFVVSASPGPELADPRRLAGWLDQIEYVCTPPATTGPIPEEPR